MDLYMPSHSTNLPLIKDQINILNKNHLAHKILLVDDFNRDILLVGRVHDDNSQTPYQEDRDWAQFMQSLALHHVHNNETSLRQGRSTTPPQAL